MKQDHCLHSRGENDNEITTSAGHASTSTAKWRLAGGSETKNCWKTKKNERLGSNGFSQAPEGIGNTQKRGRSGGAPTSALTKIRLKIRRFEDTGNMQSHIPRGADLDLHAADKVPYLYVRVSSVQRYRRHR